MEKLSQSMDPFYPSSSGPNWAPLFAEAQQLPFDGEGRISLPDLFCQHAELGETIAFVGQGPTFQIWNPSTFEAYQEASRQKLIQEQGTSYA
jgi:MraZ protein